MNITLLLSYQLLTLWLCCHGILGSLGCHECCWLWSGPEERFQREGKRSTTRKILTAFDYWIARTTESAVSGPKESNILQMQDSSSTLYQTPRGGVVGWSQNLMVNLLHPHHERKLPGNRKEDEAYLGSRASSSSC